MSPAHFILCVLSCIAFSGVANAVYEDCQTPPPVDHARAELFENEINHVNTAIYNCAVGYIMKGSNELICNVDTEEWQGEPPTCVKAKVNVHSERKKKMLAIPEELNVTIESAQKLDLSCIQAKVQAPEISHGIVSNYERRRRGDKIFLVAYYVCNDNYEFESNQALFCSAKQWVGELPTCLPRFEYTDDNDDDIDYEEDAYESIDEEAAEDLGSESQLAENPVEAVAPPPPPPPVEVEQLEPQIEPVFREVIDHPSVEVQSNPTTTAGDEEAETEVQLKVETEVEVQPAAEIETESVVEKKEEHVFENKEEPVLENKEEAVVEDKEDPVVENKEEPVVENKEEPVVETDAQPTASAETEAEIETVVVVPVEQQSSPELETATDINIVIAPTKDPYSPRLLDENCGEDRGGCAHKCQRLLFPGENEPRLKCSCNEGYTLDPQDYSSCHDIDECQESNGGCSQICNNLPGRFECACEIGYQIDSQTGNSCIDIDECTNPELSSECANECENTPGSYRCVIPLNTKDDVEEEEEAAIQESKEVEPQPTLEEPVEPVVKPEHVKPSCNPGFTLSMGASECQDINECNIVVEDDGNVDHVPHRLCQQLCENTIGSFRCSCRDGYHLLEDQITCAPDNCQDLDNPQLNRTRCAHQCENLPNGRYVCVCPEGYTLGENLHSCEVVETVCSREQGHERCRPGSCLVSEDNSTFSCLCPPGYSSEVFSCQDIDECAMGTHKCSHDCFNTAGGYQCLCPRGMSLQEPEGLTCVAPDPCAANNNGCEQLCLSADAGACTCSKGYVLSNDGKSCNDVDECHVDNGGCQQLCRNLPGSYECVCSPGYEPLEVAGLSGFCFDIDECATKRHSCDPPMQCENLNGSYTCLCEPGYAIGYDHRLHSSSSYESSLLLACLDIDECSLSNANCSHFCINLPGSFQCACPLGFSLDTDARSCQDHNECLLENGKCAQHCVNQPGGFACACNEGYELAPDGFNCLDIDECAHDFGNCSGICINLLGSHTCACDRGYELTTDGHNCQDVDECAGLLSGGCTHECINKPGSYECGCPLGYLLQEDERSCQPVLVGCPPGTHQTNQGCEPIECGQGMLIGVDGSCVDIDECKLNNGGCSHQCENVNGTFKCICPGGYILADNLHDCEDVNECSVDNGGCEESCVNEPGSFKCECDVGKTLSFDGRSCYDIPVIKPRTRVTVPQPRPVPLPTFGQSPLPQPRPVPLPTFGQSPLPQPAPIPLPQPGHLPLPPPVAVAPVTHLIPSMPELVRDQCVRFQAPANGQAHCNRYRHKRKLFYNTRCKVRCNAGYQLIGSEIRSCGASGNWEGEANKCVPITQSRRVWMTGTLPAVSTHVSCPALPAPRNGVITPASCTRGASNYRAICSLQCNMGFVPVGGMLTTCMNGWTLGSILECKPFSSNILNHHFGTRIQTPWQRQSFSQQSIPLPKPSQPQPQPIRSYIKCPENVVIMLSPHQTKAHVILQQPATNVDYRHVAAFPPWAKQLQGHLPEGTHKIIYRAHDPVTQQTVGCQTIITIKRMPSTTNRNLFAIRPLSLSEQTPARLPEFSFRAATGQKQFESLIDASPSSLTRPAENLIKETPSSRTFESSRIDLGTSTSSYCPPSFEVNLKENQNLRSVLWEEPRFEGKLLKIFKSSFPGALFGLGDHTVKYEATTTDGLTLQCTFQIHVKRAISASTPSPAEMNYPDVLSRGPPVQQTHSSLFAGHESYVVCPGKEPVKVTDKQSVNLPVGCSLKNVRPQSSLQTQPKRGLLTSLWRQYANF